ncbi:MAG: PDZ domain-containing protein, partial [Xanthomonadales bacterium]|nr:PDZ domain-containing protein [Xanthomonadales bacterium]
IFALLTPPLALAGGQPGDSETTVEYSRMVEEAELARVEAEKARREATRVAERARETARRSAEADREQAEMHSARAKEMAHERALREEEMERAREELSRAHRELREASREVAQAHRDLARGGSLHVTTHVLNLGDRPVIGVVLGEEGPAGIELVGVSPDGPAEAAGIQSGDIMVSINGTDLTGSAKGAKPKVFAVMEASKAGDPIEIVVERDGQPMSFAVVSEVREPASWQSLVRIPEITTVERIEGGPGERRFVIESTVVPELDEEALAERLELLKERLDDKDFYLHAGSLPQELDGDYEFEFSGDYSDFAGHAFSSANVWFGMPQAQGLELATVNEGLGAYFKTDRGVLVLKAKEDNAYQLEAGDVILKIGASEVKSPSEMMRALREIEPGEEVEIEIKRQRRNKTLKVEMPENRFGLR